MFQLAELLIREFETEQHPSLKESSEEYVKVDSNEEKVKDVSIEKNVKDVSSEKHTKQYPIHWFPLSEKFTSFNSG